MVAEFAIAMPAAVLVLAFGLGARATGARQVLLQDAAADGARLWARGESAERVGDAVRATVADASITLDRRGGLVCLTVSAPAPLPVIGRLSATGCALDDGAAPWPAPG